MKLAMFIVFAIIFSITLLWLDACASPATSNVTGQIFDAAGNPVPHATIYFNSLNTQVVQGTTIYPILVTSTTDANGNLSTTALAQGLFVQITICQVQGGGCGAPTTGFVPISASVTFQNLLTGTAATSSSTLTGNLNASGFKVTNLGVNTSLGDALSQGQSKINDLTTPSGNYSMGSHKFTGLIAGTGSGDSLSFGLNRLNDLASANGDYSMGSHNLKSVSAPVAASDALSEGQPIGAVSPGTAVFTDLTTNQRLFVATLNYVEAGGGTITPSLTSGSDVGITISDNSAWTLAAASGATPSSGLVAHWWIRITNTSGGAGGAITLAGNYRTDASWSTTGPANGKTRICPVLSTAAAVYYIGPCTADETN